MENGSTIGRLLVILRRGLDNRLARYALELLTKEYYVDGRRRILLADLLAVYAGEALKCPLYVRFAGDVAKFMLKLATYAARLDEEQVKLLLRDPSLRRGLVMVSKSIAKYGLGKALLFDAPFFVVWNFTNICNLRCAHCYQAGKPYLRELNGSEKIRVVDDLDRSLVTGLALSGGEPTLDPSFLPVIRRAHEYGMYPAVATNGISFASFDFAYRARRAGLRYVEISIDSARPSVHDKFRGVPGTWRKAIEGVKNAVKLRFPSVAIAMTVTKINLNEVEDVLDLAESLGVKRVVFFNFIPTGRGKENAELDLTPEEREEFLKVIYRESKRRKLEIVSTAPQYGKVIMEESYGGEVSPLHFLPSLRDPISKTVAEIAGGCGAGRVYAAIEPDGTVTPCVFLPLPVGNVKSTSFHDIWTKEELFFKLRDRDNLKGFCGRCPYRELCGGCRARAYAYYGDVFAPDPGCVYNLRNWRELARVGRP